MLRRYSGSVRVFFPKFSREDVIREVGRCAYALREELGLERVIIFGSYARGDYTAASDIDILVIFDDERSSEDKVYKSLMRNIRLPRVELHIVPKRELEAYEKSRWMRTIEEEGIKIL
ncbi:MAG: nucleotidyltransferase domain-containing protein [Candidatus Bathyarchaeia archaeon]